ncbi:DNA gyrase subunit B [Iamia majanohamensis]|uniref:DNA topoisomerase (ATP-hydrolyzing) n=2 Tax=Iamia majanohamensis TaxID=467976 RepID=A0AAE9Y7I2_9ACTN|nr:DNA gyrase subunit B [Iamia majanohamensis]WCO67111.1 DNA gyrase subunit B [Iamia majanohamensis]
MSQTTATYTASSMTILEGLAHVRKRPGMYIGGTGLSGLHHLVWEVVDNSVDEAMAGHCDRIDITLLADGGCRVADDGRGIPTDVHPEFKLTGVEIALTKLGGGGKFGGDGYKVSGGLHGVGVSVVNALSSRVLVQVDQRGKRHEIEFAEGGAKKTSLTVVGDAPRGRTGTTVTFWPDETIFESTEFAARTMLERFQMMAFLNKALEIRFKDEREGHDPTPVSYRYANGIVDFVKHVNASKNPLFTKVGSFEQVEDEHEVELAFQWNDGYQTDGLHSFANGIATIEGGTHEEGFRAALTTVLNKYARGKGLLKEKDANLAGEDVREGLTAIISVRLREPQFEGQTKAKLGNPEIKSLVQKATNEHLSWWLEEHPTEGNKIIKKAINAQRARAAARQARDATRRKSALDGAGMPDKLRDCSSRNRDECELFIVEGDSAGGSATSARDPRTQAILPIRGKILNVERAQIDRMLKNNEVQALIAAIGAGFGEEFEITKARYDRVILLCDADVDGSHIRTLLLTFFFRHMKELVEQNHVYIAQPPLYSTVVGKEKVYLKDDAAKARFLAENPTHKKEFSRLKGLGEMDWQELKATTMDSASRTLLQVGVEQAAAADTAISTLMGDDVAARKDFIQKNAKDVRFIDI